jgi:transposase
MTDKPLVSPLVGSLIGIDVSKHWLDACLFGQAGVERIANTPQAIAAWLKRASPDLVALEPTGGYERTLCAALRERGIRYAKLHPNALLAFRKSRGIRAKTDRIDARLIADFAADSLARGAIPPAIEHDETLRALAARRRQLCDALHAERCRLDLADGQGGVQRSVQAVIKALARSLDAIEAAIAQHINASPETKALSARLQTIRGIGPVTAMTLIADLPDPRIKSGDGKLGAKQAAALVGLAPQTRESGKTRYRARTGHGRALVRSVLFNAARAAIRHPSPMREFYDRLVHQNQCPGKVALCAVMRKLVVIADAVARDARRQCRAQTA